MVDEPYSVLIVYDIRFRLSHQILYQFVLIRFGYHLHIFVTLAITAPVEITTIMERLQLLPPLY